MEIIKICKECNKSFFPKKNTKGIFCSERCRIENKKIEEQHRICEFCKKDFITSVKCRNSKQKYCSQNCFKNKLTKKNDEMIMKKIKKNRRDRYDCKKCNNERCKKYRLNNLEEIRIKKSLYFQRPEVKKRHTAKTTEWKRKNHEKTLAGRAIYRKKYKEQIKEKAKKQVEELKPYYVKNCMVTKLPINEIPKELIELKRIHMKLKRKLKEIKNVNK